MFSGHSRCRQDAGAQHVAGVREARQGGNRRDGRTGNERFSLLRQSRLFSIISGFCLNMDKCLL